MKFIVSVGLLIFALQAYGQKILPYWVSSPPKPTNDLKYYVGSSNKVASHGEAIKAASNAALEQAIRENFGTKAKISSESFESEISANSTLRVSEQSNLINIEGFETVESFIAQSNEGFSAYILFSYKISEINREKIRLANITTKTQDPNFSEIGNVSNASKGRLEIITHPGSASVVIDGKDAITKTPIRMIGVIDSGEHIVTIDHPDYETIQESFIMTPGTTVRIEKTLVPANGVLRIDTEPSGATVILNGQPKGTTPINRILVAANKKHKVEFIHPDAQLQSIETTVAKDETKLLREVLKLKDAKLQIAAKPPTANIKIDDRQVTKGWNTLPPGQYTVEISADGHQSKQLSISLRGGEQKIEKVSLIPLSEIEKLEEDLATRKKDYPWILGFGFSFWGKTNSDNIAPVGISVSLEKILFKNLLGLKIEGHTLSSEEKNSSGNNRKLTGSFFGLSIPFYYNEYYVAPMSGKISQSISCITNNSCSSNSYSQSLTGLQIGYQSLGDSLGLNINYSLVNLNESASAAGTKTGVFQIVGLFKF